MTIGQKIRKVREFKNFTREYMSDKLGMSLAGYGKIERDDIDIPYSRLEQIATTLDMKTEDLISFDAKTVFNIMNNRVHNMNINDSKITDPERELYNKTIALLEDRIKKLEEE